jgi:uncharacterized integral membrane protein (TIGR00698 family)
MNVIVIQTAPMTKQAIRKIAFMIVLALCASPWVSSPIALATGFLFSHFVGHPYNQINHKATNWLLKIAVVGLGFGMNIHSAISASREGFVLTILSVATILTLGLIIGRLLKIKLRTSHLVSSGTAICGGSAIAAVAPVVNASEKEISVSLGVVFLLNAIALLVFPPVGLYLGLSQQQFGMWSAIAIHDTSSVVGAAATYGKEALEVAVTVKLARALWIIPVALLSAFVFRGDNKKISVPWFIGFFLLAILANSYIPVIASISKPLVYFSKSALVMTLFLIGAGLSVEKIRAVGWRPLALGASLWVFISVASLFIILNW